MILPSHRRTPACKTGKELSILFALSLQGQDSSILAPSTFPMPMPVPVVVAPIFALFVSFGSKAWMELHRLVNEWASSYFFLFLFILLHNDLPTRSLFIQRPQSFTLLQRSEAVSFPFLWLIDNERILFRIGLPWLDASLHRTTTYVSSASVETRQFGQRPAFSYKQFLILNMKLPEWTTYGNRKPSFYLFFLPQGMFLLHSWARSPYDYAFHWQMRVARSEWPSIADPVGNLQPMQWIQMLSMRVDLLISLKWLDS